MEWLSANASAIIAAASALLAAIIAGVTTVLSIFFTNKSNKALRQEQFEFDKWKANRDFFLAKGEELFTLFNKWHELVHDLHMHNSFSLFKIKIDKGDKNDVKEITLKEITPKVSAINSMFFTDLVDDFEELNSLSGKMTVSYAQSLTGEISKSDAAKFIDETMNILRFKSDEFRNKIAEKVRCHL